MRHPFRRQANRRDPRTAVAIQTAVLAAAAGMAACVGPSRMAGPSQQSASLTRAKYVCTAILSQDRSSPPSVSCTPAGASRSVVARGAGLSTQDVVLQNQGINVLLTLSNFAYNSSTYVFSMACTITNLLTQPIGSTNNSTTTPAGVRVYFTYGPVPSGPGTVSVLNPSGDTLFLGQEDPYFEYTPFIKAGATSPAMTWEFQNSANSKGFNFAVEVDAAVPSQNSILRWTSLRQGVTPQPLTAVWQNTASNVWAVGDTGVILNYNGTQWSLQSTGLSSSNMYNSVWGTSASDVWAVGNGGVAVHYNGTAWSSGSTGVATNLAGIWGYSPSGYYAVGTGGKTYFYDGSTWTKVSYGFNANTALHAVWGTDAEHVFIVGNKGLILFYDGTTWSEPASPTSEALYAIWGTSATNVYAVGAEGTVIHYNGTAWSTQTTNTSSPELTGVGGTSATDIWAVGQDGTTMHSADGSTWTTVSPVAGLAFSAVAAATSGPLWAVGGSGSLFTLANGNTVTLSNQSGLQLLGVWASDTAHVWAAAPGTILFYNGSTWTSSYISNAEPLSAVWGTGATNVYVVGQKGTIANYNGTSWTVVFNAATGFNGIWGTSATNIYAVGNSGFIKHWNGTSWSTSTNTGSGDLTSVWGGGSTPTFFAVADDGTAYTSVNGGAWTAVTFNPSNSAALYGVFGTSTTDVWATGNSGAAYVNTGTGFADPSPTNSLATNFSGVWNTSASDVYLVGASGTVQYYDGSVWFTMPTPVTTTLEAMYGTAQQNAYVVGDNGVVLRGTGP